MNSSQVDEFTPLLAGLLEGDRLTEDRFFRVAWQRLRAWSRTNFRIPEKDVEDFAIEVIEKALSKLSTFSPARGKFVTWLFVIARHCAVDRARRLASGRDVLHGALDEEIVKFQAAPEVEVEERESCLHEALMKELASLPVSDRELLLLA